MIPIFLSLAVISLICFIAQFEPFASLMVWERLLISAQNHHEWWRIITGNFTHTNWPHYAMNMIALWLIVMIFRPSAKHLWLSLLWISTGVGSYLLVMSPHLNAYAGLSGVLHGLFLSWALHEALEKRRSSWLLVLAAIVKVGWEQWIGPSPMTQALINAPVAIDAHLAGLICGFLLAAVQNTFQWIRHTQI